jgi:glycine/D-amino acid oxidase-like deaminating enzyme
MDSCDVVVIGAGVVGASVAFHLARLGAGKVLVLERNAIGNGTTAQSSGVLRTHYSVRENVELALRSWDVFSHFAAYVDDPEASCGLVKCGYMIAAPEGDKQRALEASVAAQRDMGIAVEILDCETARARLPIAQLDDAALIAYEPDAGFADPYLVTQAFAKAARRMGVALREGVEVRGLVVEGGRVSGVETDRGRVACGCVVSVQNIWSRQLERDVGMPMPVEPERHIVLALQSTDAYTHRMPVFKDLASPGLLYCRSYGGAQMLVSEGTAGETLPGPDIEQGPVPMEIVGEIGMQVAQRFPAYETAGLASSWTGVYDVTPDWNPVLGRLPGIQGLVVGFGFSGHGFKLSPVVGRVLAQEALGLPTDVSLAPYSFERFARGALLLGRYGSGALS